MTNASFAGGVVAQGTPGGMTDVRDARSTQLLAGLGAELHVRGWLSANAIVFVGAPRQTCTVVDTGYATHATQTVQLVERALQGRPLERIVNTHLHSDHCGGNAALQGRYPHAQTSAPIGYRHAAEPWDPKALSFEFTGQQCTPFRVTSYLEPGSTIELGGRPWEIHAAGGHDPDALMFFEPVERVLISGDALWEHRLAIIFPELVGGDGFGEALRTLDAIEQLAPRVVLPGHGDGFVDVAQAVKQSRRRLEAMAAAPARHREHAARALAMFHMLEVRRQPEDALRRWMASTPIFACAFGLHDPLTAASTLNSRVHQVISDLVADGLLAQYGKEVGLPAPAD